MLLSGPKPSTYFVVWVEDRGFDVCDGVYQLALKFSPMIPGGTGYRVLFIKRTFQLWMVIYQRACHVTLGSNVTKFHSALERKPCTSY